MKRIAQFDAIARVQPIPRHDLLNLETLPHMLFEYIQRGEVEVPRAANPQYPYFCAWLAGVLTAVGVARQMQRTKKTKRVGDYLFKAAEAGYMAFAEAAQKAHQRGADHVVMTSDQLEASRRYLNAWCLVLPTLTVGQLADGAAAAERGIGVFLEML